ncbi:energy transducer TonB [Pleionea litopenaei]|uniref:Energy transducer TonB n=1 Tax=Pleionea litopenaei TaxID=3070815 RepID=A0AA51RVT3_9GAMM|nr:energy transducer TonB [Pleionea sp. HL-JVS1]WMS88379.1 energy transducer TonB [Pleionea sp. HL-JVS1]
MKYLLLIVLLCLTSCASTERSIETSNAHDNGYVKFIMDVDETGAPVNPKIIESHPKGVFDKIAIAALLKWKFKPKYVDGVAVVQRDLKYTMEFNAADEEQP